MEYLPKVSKWEWRSRRSSSSSCDQGPEPYDNKRQSPNLRRRILRKPLISSWATIGSLVRGYEEFRRRIHQLPQHLKIEQSDSLLVKPLAILHKLSEIGLPTSCGSCGQPSINVLLRRTVRILALLRTSKTSTRGGLKTIPRGLRMTNQQWWRCC